MRAAPSSTGISAAPVDGDAHVGRGAHSAPSDVSTIARTGDVIRILIRVLTNAWPISGVSRNAARWISGCCPPTGAPPSRSDRRTSAGRIRSSPARRARPPPPWAHPAGRAGLNRPVAEQLLQDLLHLPRDVVRRPGRTSAATRRAASASNARPDAWRKERREKPDIRTTIGRPRGWGKFAYWDPVSHFATHALRLRATSLRDVFRCNAFRPCLLSRSPEGFAPDAGLVAQIRDIRIVTAYARPAPAP